MRRQLPPSQDLVEYFNACLRSGDNAELITAIVARVGVDQCAVWGLALTEEQAVASFRRSSDLLRFWTAVRCEKTKHGTRLPLFDAERLRTIISHPLWREHSVDDVTTLLSSVLEARDPIPGRGASTDVALLRLLEELFATGHGPRPLQVKAPLLELIANEKRRSDKKTHVHGYGVYRYRYDVLAYVFGRRPECSDLNAATLLGLAKCKTESWRLTSSVAQVAKLWPDSLPRLAPLHPLLIPICVKHAVTCPERGASRSRSTALTELLCALAARPDVPIPASLTLKCEHCTREIHRIVAARFP
jgi:hypothetical protein